MPEVMCWRRWSFALSCRSRRGLTPFYRANGAREHSGEVEVGVGAGDLWQHLPRSFAGGVGVEGLLKRARQRGRDVVVYQREEEERGRERRGKGRERSSVAIRESLLRI